MCQLIVRTALETAGRKIVLPPAIEASWVEQLVRSHTIKLREAKDELQHLHTIRDAYFSTNSRQEDCCGLISLGGCYQP